MDNFNKHIESLIDTYVDGQKKIKPNFFLAARVTSKINAKGPAVILPVWQNALIVLGMIMVVFAGIELGDLYYNYTSLSLGINDAYIENLSYYLNE